MRRSFVVASCLLLSLISAHGQQPLKLGETPPPLTHTQLLQAPAGAKVDWPSLRGKVVVLEFWAIWCAPCVEEIPTLNKLADSLDPGKVLFISIDDENPDKVQAFLKKNPISGWVMIDATSAVFKRYAVFARPTTIVVDAKGHVVSTVVRPENLKREALLQLADGKPVQIETAEEEKAQEDINEAMAEDRDAQAAEKYGSTNALFNLAITKGDDSKTTVAFLRGPGMADVLNATPDKLLVDALRIPDGRLKVNGSLPKTAYNLYLHAPSANAGQLTPALDLAIQNACGVRIERHSSIQDVYVLQALDKSKPLPNLASTPSGSVAFYNEGEKFLQFVHADPNQIAEILEQAVGRPVVNESGITKEFADAFQLPSGDFGALRSALERNTGLTLVPAKRPVEMITMTPNPEAQNATANPH